MRRKKLWAAAGALAVLLSITIAFLRFGAEPETSATPQTAQTSSPPLTSDQSQPPKPDRPPKSQPATTPTLHTDPTMQTLSGALHRIKDLLRRGAQPSEIFAAFDDLRRLVHEMEPSVAAAALLAELRSGFDAPTGLPFEVGAEGVLDSAPTYRTWLLDLLGQTDPREAVAFSREILPYTPSADEYSLALRNLTWGLPTGASDPEVQAAFLAMLTRPDWIASPSAGFLEAFDIAVAIGPSTIPQVAAILEATAGHESSNAQALAYAAFVALDRLVLSDPNAFLRNLRANPNFLSASPDYLSSLISRLDVRIPQHRAYLEAWIPSRSPSAPSTTYFFEVFPNGNRFDSPRLVTSSANEPPSRPMSEIDSATLQTLERWRADPRFHAHAHLLEAATARIRAYYNP